MPRKPKVQTRLPEDTHDLFERYRDNRDISKADATRRLIDTGLEHEPIDPGPDEHADDTQARVFEQSLGGLSAGQAAFAFSALNFFMLLALVSGL